MKITYIAEWDACQNSGVLSKMLMQIKAWDNLGHNVTLILISLPGKYCELHKNVNILTSPHIGFFPKCIQKYANKILCVKKLKCFLKEASSDLIYYRQAIWYPGLAGCLAKSPCVVELNTHDLGEKKILSLPARLFYLLGRRYIIECAKGFVSVSFEIERHYIKYKKPIITIGNGVEFYNKDFPTAKISENNRPQLVFAGTPGQPWHGVDKLYLMAKLLPEFDFHVVGASMDNSLDNLYAHGYMKHEELMSLYQYMDVGIGTLALHRKDMEEASPLKTREYALFSLPMIIGYIDTDLYFEDYLLNIGNFEDNVRLSIDKIRSFVLAWKGRYVDRTLMEKKLSIQHKEARKLDFFRDILNN